VPPLGFVTLDDEAAQSLILGLLRPGPSAAKLGAIARLRRLFAKLRAAFPGARLRVRLDGGFAGDDVLRVLEAEDVEYVVALGKNRRLEKRVRRHGQSAHAPQGQRADRTSLRGNPLCCSPVESPPPRHHEGRGGPACRPRPKNNPRFVVTNLPHTPEHVYTIYRQRGDVENRIKELKAALALDRLICSRFLGNKFRLLLTVAA